MLTDCPCQDLDDDCESCQAIKAAARQDEWCRKHKLGKYAEVIDDLTNGRTVFARYKGRAIMVDAKLTDGKLRVRYTPTAFASSEPFDIFAHELYTTIGSHCDELL